MTTTGVVALAITSALLGIAFLAIFFLLRHVLMNQTNRRGSDTPLPQNKESSETFSDLNTTEGVSVHNIGCKGGRAILWSFRRVIKHLGKCSYSIHVTHAFSSIQIHILFNVRCYDRTWSLAWKLNNMFGRAICDKKCKTSKGLTRIQNRSDVSKHLTQLIFVLFII